LVFALDITSPGTYDVSVRDTIHLENGMAATIIEISDRILEYGNPTGQSAVSIAAGGYETILNEGESAEMTKSQMTTTKLMRVKVNSIDLNAGKASITITDLLAEKQNLPNATPISNASQQTQSPTSTTKELITTYYILGGIIAVLLVIILYLVLRKK